MLRETLKYFIQHYSVFCSGRVSFFLFFWGGHTWFGDPNQGTNSMKPLSPNHWTTWEFPVLESFC